MVRLFPDGLITLDVLQYVKGVSKEKVLQRDVSSQNHDYQILQALLVSCFIQ